MLTTIMILSMFCGYEGYDNGKLYVGIYTPKCEYGYVIKKIMRFILTAYMRKTINIKHKE